MLILERRFDKFQIEARGSGCFDLRLVIWISPKAMLLISS